MKSKYCFLRHPGKPKPGDVIYTIWVGSYLREFAKLQLVQEYCKDVGLYLSKWSPEVDSQLDEWKARYRQDGNPLSSPFLTTSITINKLYAMIIDDSFESFEASISMTPFEKWCQYHHTIKYYQSINKTNVIHHAYPPERKNLSVRNRSEVQNAVICGVLVLVLLVIDAIMDNLMNW